MPIYDSRIDSFLQNRKIAMSNFQSRTVVLGGTPSRGVVGNIVLSDGSGDLVGTGALVSHPAWVELELSKPDALVYVAVVDDREATGSPNLKYFGGQLATTGQAFYTLRLTVGDGRGFPTTDLTRGSWTSGSQVGAFAQLKFPPIFWAIDTTGGASTGVKSYGFRIEPGTTVTDTRMTRIRIMAMEIFA